MTEQPMEIHRPTFKNEFNLTTMATVVGLIVVLGGWVWQASQINTEFKTWIANHEQLHKDRQVVVTSDQSRNDQRMLALESHSADVSRTMDNVTYRLTVQEQGVSTLGKSVEELKTAVGNQAADLRVALEILRRLDPATNGINGQQRE